MAHPKRVLDLFCGAGGAAMGLHRAWPDAEILGVDISPQSRYPFRFMQADAMTFPLEDYDFIWASPPCQDYSASMRHRQTTGREHPRLIEGTEARIITRGIPWVIENVLGSQLPSSSNLWGEHGVMLCGTMFGLERVWRHRLFKASFPFKQMPCRHTVAPLNPYNTKSRKRDGLEKGSMRAYAKAMGVEWMRDKEATEAIPPVYSEFVARQFA